MKNSTLRIGSLIFLCNSFLSCDKEDLKWDLDEIVRLPKVITISANNIYNTGASINSEVTEDGGSDVTQRGVCWSTNQNPNMSDSITNNGKGVSTFNSIISGLTVNTTYYLRAYATNAEGTAYSNEINFKTTNTSTSLPTITTSTASNIIQNEAVSGGNVVSNGGSAVTQRGVCWSTNPSPTLIDNSKASGNGLGRFTTALSGLSSNTSYYVRAYATNSQGTAYGNQISFKTATPSATLVSSKGCSSLNGTNSLYYGMNGTSSSWGLSNSGYSGSCWVAPDPNKSGNLGTVVGSNHYIEFTHNFSSQGYIEFWVNTYNPGYSNLIPSIKVNGSAIGSATKIGGQTSSFNWMQVRTPIISAGNNKVRIVLSGSYYVLKIDEIKIYKY